MNHLLRLLDSILGLSDTSRESRLGRLVKGVVIPSVPLIYGVSCVVSRHAMIIGRGGIASLSGLPAIGIGVAYAAVGLLIYVHSCWEDHPQLAGARDAARGVLLLVIIVALLSTFALVLI